MGDFHKTLAKLYALKDNLPAYGKVDEKYVHSFHEIIEELVGLGLDVEDLKIPQSELNYEISSISVNHLEGTSSTSYSNTRSIEREFLLMKIDTIINLINIKNNNEDKKEESPIGFRVK